MTARTMAEKIWDDHAIGDDLLFIVSARARGVRGRDDPIVRRIFTDARPAIGVDPIAHALHLLLS